MKLMPLYDLQQEINRLFIAGSKFAKNDPRLQKHIPVFNKLGEKAPVFKKIAENLDSLVNAELADSSAKLLEISTLLYAVLYTQGETVDTEQTVETQLEPTLSVDKIFTDASYLSLKPLIEILTQQKQGRLETLRDAVKEQQINDFRIYHLLDRALADPYSEFADYVEKTVIPTIGLPMLPFVARNFSYEGKPDDVRRFRLLAQFAYSEAPAMVEEILAGKSVPLQAEAVKFLGKNPENEQLLLKFAEDGQKTIRLAAYEALKNLNTENAQQKLFDLFITNKKKSDRFELSLALTGDISEKYLPELLSLAKTAFDNCLELDKSSEQKAVIKCFEELRNTINPLTGNVNGEIFGFFEELFSNKKYNDFLSNSQTKNYQITNIADSIEQNVAENLAKLSETDLLKVLWEKSKKHRFLCFYFEKVLKKMDKTQVFKYFAPHANILFTNNTLSKHFSELKNDEIDESWTKVIEKQLLKSKKEVDISNVHLYLQLVGAKSQEAQSLVKELIVSTKNLGYDFNQLAGCLIKSEHKQAFKIIFDVINSLAKKSWFYGEKSVFKHFPLEYAEKFRNLGEKLNSYYSNTYYQIASIIEDVHFQKNLK